MKKELLLEYQTKIGLIRRIYTNGDCETIIKNNIIDGSELPTKEDIIAISVYFDKVIKNLKGD